MSDSVDSLILDLIEWLTPQPRAYAEVIEAWRTSCPRLQIWEEAQERGLIERQNHGPRGTLVAVTPQGRALLASRQPQVTTA